MEIPFVLFLMFFLLEQEGAIKLGGYVVLPLFFLMIVKKMVFVLFRGHRTTSCLVASRLECVGIADRSAFDLTAHANAAKCDLQYKEMWLNSGEVMLGP